MLRGLVQDPGAAGADSARRQTGASSQGQRRGLGGQDHHVRRERVSRRGTAVDVRSHQTPGLPLRAGEDPSFLDQPRELGPCWSASKRVELLAREPERKWSPHCRETKAIEVPVGYIELLQEKSRCRE